MSQAKRTPLIVPPDATSLLVPFDELRDRRGLDQYGRPQKRKKPRSKEPTPKLSPRRH